MGMLDQVIGSVIGQMVGGGRSGDQGRGGAISPIVQALLMLLLQKGMSGGLGDVFGGGHRPEPDTSHGPGSRPDQGDLGGFGQGGSAKGGGSGGESGEYGDLAGMLDGPGGAPAASDRGPGAGPYAQLDHDGGGQGGAQGGGLDDLIGRFERGGLGDVMQSWIGGGQNRPVAPDRLAGALGADTVDALQSRTGLDRGALLSQLAQALPQVVDALTPHGRVPDAHERRGW